MSEVTLHINTSMLKASAEPKSICVANKVYFADVFISAEGSYHCNRISTNLALLIIAYYKSKKELRDLFELKLLPEDVYALELKTFIDNAQEVADVKVLQETLTPFVDHPIVKKKLTSYPYMHTEIVGLHDGQVNKYSFKRLPLNYNQPCEVYLQELKTDLTQPFDKVKLLFVSPYTCTYCLLDIEYALYKCLFQLNSDKYYFCTITEDEVKASIPVLKSNGYILYPAPNDILSYLFQLTTSYEKASTLLGVHLDSFKQLLDTAYCNDITTINKTLNEQRKIIYRISDSDWLLT